MRQTEMWRQDTQDVYIRLTVLDTEDRAHYSCGFSATVAQRCYSFTSQNKLFHLKAHWQIHTQLEGMLEAQRQIRMCLEQHTLFR